MTPPPTRLAVDPPLRSHRHASRRVARSKGTYACHISHVLSFNFPQSSSIASRRVHPFSARRLRPRPRVPRSPGGPPPPRSHASPRARALDARTHASSSADDPRLATHSNAGSPIIQNSPNTATPPHRAAPRACRIVGIVSTYVAAHCERGMTCFAISLSMATLTRRARAL